MRELKTDTEIDLFLAILRGCLVVCMAGFLLLIGRTVYLLGGLG